MRNIIKINDAGIYVNLKYGKILQVHHNNPLQKYLL
jgi:hypothetical protein